MFQLKVFNVAEHGRSFKLAEFMSWQVVNYWKHHLELIEERCQQGNNYFIECGG